MKHPIVPASALLAIAINTSVVIALRELLAAWVMLFWAAASALSLFAALRQQPVPLGATARRFLAIALITLAIFSHWQSGVLPTLTQVVVVLLTIKQLELESQRDAFQIVALALLAMGIAGFFRADLGLAFILAGFFVAVLTLLIWQPLVDACVERLALGWSRAAAVALLGLLMTLLVIPLALLFFLLIPRSSTPLVQWSPIQNQAAVGFSPDMRPGSVGNIASSQDIAFRAQITPAPANAADLYWQGAVLWRNSGQQWLPAPPRAPQALPETGAPGTVQSITLNPNQTDYLFSLAKPDSVTGIHDFYAFADGTLRLQTMPSLPMRYTVVSRPARPATLDAETQRAALQLPADLDPRLITIAQAFANDAPEQGTGRLIEWLSQPPFRYSLSSPKGYPNGQSLAQFLSETRVGYCELYAAALATLLRINGIPARVVVGYRGGEYNPLGDYWVVRQNRAHAWVEAWYAERGWVLLDATPGTPVNPFPSQQTQTPQLAAAQMPRQQRPLDWLQWQWSNVIINLTPEKQQQILQSLRSRLSQAIRPPQQSNPAQSDALLPPKWLFGGLALLLLAALLWYYRKAAANKDPNAYFRRLAAQRLLRSTPVKIDLKPAGQEAPIWAWWQQHDPQRWHSLQQLYLAQRYGPRPSAAGDQRLQQYLRLLEKRRSVTS